MRNTKDKKTNLSVAYGLVLDDLLSSLKILKDKGKIKLGDLGTLTKQKRKVRTKMSGKLKTYLYYQVSFKASDWLKQELNKSL